MLSIPADWMGKPVEASTAWLSKFYISSIKHSQVPAFQREKNRFGHQHFKAPGQHPLHLRAQLERHSPPVPPEDAQSAESESNPNQIVNTLCHIADVEL